MKVDLGTRQLTIRFFTQEAPLDVLYQAVVLGPRGYEPAPNILPFRSWTRCTIEDGEARAIGFARCSEVDEPLIGSGNRQALTKALMDGPYTKPERARIWEAFFEVARRSGWFADTEIALPRPPPPAALTGGIKYNKTVHP